MVKVAALLVQMSDRWRCNITHMHYGTNECPWGCQNDCTYAATERFVSDSVKQLLIEKLIAAGEEEQKLAIESGDSHQGVSAVIAVVDGGWSKRCHKHSYNAKSAVAVIFWAMYQETFVCWCLQQVLCSLFCAREAGEGPTRTRMLPQLVQFVSSHGERYCAEGFVYFGVTN